MKFSNCLALPLLVSSVWGTRMDAVYQLNSEQTDLIPVIKSHDALLYLSDKFDISNYYNIGENGDAAIEFIEDQRKLAESKEAADMPKAKLVAVVSGVSRPLEIFENIKPSFLIQNNTLHFNKNVLRAFPKQISNDGGYNMSQLTSETMLLSKNSQSSTLPRHFQHFDQKFVGIWNEFKRNKQNANQVILSNKQDASLDVINDNIFISEVSQLVHFSSAMPSDDDYLFMNLDMLYSLGSKVGSDSQTYLSAVKVLAECLESLSLKYDVTVIMEEEHSKVLKSDVRKRDQELNEVLKNSRITKKASSGPACFSSEDACKVGTSSCNSHGQCSKVGECWSCVCAATHNDDKSKTTYWSGFDCGKKDISSEANLFLFSTLGLLVLFIGGIQLLYSVGNESLPGVLGAATASKKTQ